MQRLLGITQLVKKILTTDKDARSSDHILYLHFVREYCKKYDFDIEKMSVPMYLLHGREMGIPTIESVGRVRRKIQEEYPSLRACKAVQDARDDMEHVFREYSEVKNV